MNAPDDLRSRARATWESGDWDSFARLLVPVGDAVLRRVGDLAGQTLIDVGTGNGANVAIPAALRGARVVGVDVAPALLRHAEQHAERAGVTVDWIDADAAALPFADGTFDVVVSTFGAMFVPDHLQAAKELVRVARSGGQVLMTTWIAEGFVGELFALTASYGGAQPAEGPPDWGRRDHIERTFSRAGVSQLEVDRDVVVFQFPSVDAAVDSYAREFGPFATLHASLAPDRWTEFIAAFRDLVERFDQAAGDGACIPSDYFVISAVR